MAPRKQVDDLQGVTSVSAPSTSVQGAIAFGPRDNALLDLAQSLKGINRQLGDYADKVIEQENAALVEEGKRMAMLDDAKSFKQYVEKGGEPMASPWVVYGYKQQKGRVLGQSYQAFIADKKMNWAGSGSDDIDGQALVNELPKWRQEFLQSQGEIDPVEMTGFDAYSVSEEDNMLRQHIAEARQTATENLGTQIYNEFYNLLGKPGIKKEELYARFDEIYNRQDFIGLRKQVGPLLLRAVSDYAEESGDANAVDIVEGYTRRDANTGQVLNVMKNTRAAAELDKARTRALSRSVQLDNLRQQQEADDRNKATRNVVDQTIEDIVTNRAPVDAFKIAKLAKDSGGDAAQALSQASAINSVLRNERTGRSADAMRDVVFDIMTNPRIGDKNEVLKRITPFADTGDLKEFHEVWKTFQDGGETLFAKYPSLEMLAMNSTIATDTGTKRMPKDLSTKLMVDSVRQVTKMNVKPEAFEQEVRKKFNELKKETFDPFSVVPEAGVDVNGVPMGASKPQAAADAKTSTLSLNVATISEIRAVAGKPREQVDVLLRAKPLMPAAQFISAISQMRANQQGIERRKLISMMSSIGIDTSNEVSALKEFLRRGQARFYPAANQRPNKQ
jgi:hypothetical protein